MQVDAAQLPHIKGVATAKGVWDKLKQQHRKQGMLTQVTLLTKAFATRLDQTLDPPMAEIIPDL